MSAGVQNLVISLGAMQLARKIPFDDPETLNYVRIGYVASQLVVLGVYYYISAVIKKKNDQTVLKYVEPANPMSQDAPQLVTTTVRDYDLSETSKLLRSTYMSLAMMAVMHFYFHFTQPLFVQGLMGIKNLYDAKPVKIHLFGAEAKDELKRPFKVASMFGAASGPQTDAAAIAEAEKRIGKKDD
ncbi:SRP-independent targeting protein 3 [Psilocybe cubensis]|uniref:Uncharacterized protein n=2 Tax=Psilocybe cubensis TaxID=181762 RepID=A0A8H7XMX4_PSICU|nr:SRP-independent targeting protein 3 [Psilocybe cubensis]KAH9482027.1 SRP-independent targeting protein 3 [Psilocybe cubensis]